MNLRHRPSPENIRALKRGFGFGALLGTFVGLPALCLLSGMWFA